LIHDGFDQATIASGEAFETDYLASRVPAMSRYRSRLGCSSWRRAIFNRFTARRGVWHGSNASCWRRDALAINGFNESFSYGSDDREFGAPLDNAGIRGKWLKYSLIELHLDHPGIDSIAARIARDQASSDSQTVASP
jgi:hypothetical protein